MSEFQINHLLQFGKFKIVDDFVGSMNSLVSLMRKAANS